jgi:hypothetical protein
MLLEFALCQLHDANLPTRYAGGPHAATEKCPMVGKTLSDLGILTQDALSDDD